MLQKVVCSIAVGLIELHTVLGYQQAPQLYKYVCVA